MIVSFTGHRPDKIINKRADIFVKIRELLKILEPSKAISGMCIGVDLIAAEACYVLNIPFIAAVPFVGQENKWNRNDQAIYNVLLRKASHVEVICEGGYAPWKYQKRNEWMIDHSDKLIAVYNGDLSGGTFNTIKYAKKINKPIEYINI